MLIGADGVGSKKLEKWFLLWSGVGVVKGKDDDGEINSRIDGVGVENNLAGVMSEGVGKNAGVDNIWIVASPFKSRMGEMGVKLAKLALEDDIESLFI
jgi:hypothetical protein